MENEDSMKKVALICARTSQNLGMVSVDLAGEDLLKNTLKEYRLDRFCIEESRVIEQKKMGTLNYTYLFDPQKQLSEYDLIIFWGDFLHAYKHIEEIALRISNNSEKSIQEAKHHVYKTFLFEDLPEKLLKKTATIGGTIYINSIKNNYNTRYKNAISRLYTNCVLIAHREPYSSIMSALFAKTNKNIINGIDNAFFLNTDNLLFAGKTDGFTVGYAMGRAVNMNNKTSWVRFVTKRFIKKLAKRFDSKKIIDIDWLIRGKSSNLLSDKIEKIRDCDIVVTDIYHCAITCWREKTPVVCLGFGLQVADSSVHDKKKEILYNIIQAQNYYVYIEHLIFNKKTKRIIYKIAEEIDSKNYEMVFENIQQQKNNIMASFKSKLF